MTGVLCVWFVGTKLERVRFDHRAIDPGKEVPSTNETSPPAATGDYGLVLDTMVGAMNTQSKELVTGGSPVKSGKQRMVKDRQSGKASAL